MIDVGCKDGKLRLADSDEKASKTRCGGADGDSRLSLLLVLLVHTCNEQRGLQGG